MRHRHGCRPRSRFEFNFPEALHAMGGPRGGQGGWGDFQFDFDWGGRGRRRRGGGRVLDSSDLRLLLLKLIGDTPRHGYNLIREIEELTGGEYAPSPGVVYPTLSLLVDEELIEEQDEPGVRRAYAITDAGRAHLDERKDEAEALIERLKGLAPGEPSTAGPAIGRAVKNLMTALRHRVARDGMNDDLLHEIAAILDEAAQRIERTK